MSRCLIPCATCGSQAAVGQPYLRRRRAPSTIKCCRSSLGHPFPLAFLPHVCDCTYHVSSGITRPVKHASTFLLLSNSICLHPTEVATLNIPLHLQHQTSSEKLTPRSQWNPIRFLLFSCITYCFDVGIFNLQQLVDSSNRSLEWQYSASFLLGFIHSVATISF